MTYEGVWMTGVRARVCVRARARAHVCVMAEDLRV